MSPSQLDFHGESLLAGSSINGCAGCFRGLVQGQRGMWKALPHFFLFSFLNENFPCNFPLLHHSSFSLLRNLLYSLFIQNTLALSPSYKKKLRSSKSKKMSEFPWWYAVTWHWVGNAYILRIITVQQFHLNLSYSQWVSGLICRTVF